ncbi:unnamed protein product [Cyclocybe aegerita]|uniref:AB hydrolase-1 domain-containing protein n=1 Tax=Cyclocybe aegerita TaxID=1973307 RepID=A0A8S0WHV7_CYCAE|nr:unnamed protein product [Cyclocybe aegerita]
MKNFGNLVRSALTAVALAQLANLIPYARGQGQIDFDTGTLANLTWVGCYSEATQCTRLSVPLNYSDPSIGTAAIALIRIPSPLGLTGDDSYRGPVLFNPGGPGGSGVEAVLSLGDAIASVLGPEFDFVGFDPRGVNHSTPQISFFNSEPERAAFDFSATALNMDANSFDGLPERWARMQVLGRLAKDRDTGILNHLTTHNVARDMLSIVHAHGEEKLMYWGISYGCILGSTFAAMFPDKVERLIIDGVPDVEGYYDMDFSNSVLDADKALQTFFDGCAAAGPDLCAFHSPTSSAIKNRLSALSTSLLEQSVPAYSPSLPAYGVLNYVTLQRALFSALYAPYELFSLLAQGLKALEEGDGSLVYQLAQPLATEETVAIGCTDADLVEDGPEEMKAYAERTSGISSFSNLMASYRLVCTGWKIHPNNFRGPISGNTGFPMLVIGNTADQITPLAMAKKVATGFPGSVVLTQDSPGHTSFGAPSECTLGHVQRYFQNGTLPEEGVVCNVTTPLFPPPSNATTPARSCEYYLNSTGGNWKTMSIHEGDAPISIQEEQREESLGSEADRGAGNLPTSANAGEAQAPRTMEDEQEGSRDSQEEPEIREQGIPDGDDPLKKDVTDHWSAILKPLQENDAAQCAIWKGEVDNILIFASLFSAVVTAFVVESYKDLKPDPNEATVVLLTRIVARLDNALNGSTSPLPTDEAIPFSPSSITVNVFWVLSLVVSLTTVLIGIVATQWLREHQQYPAHFSVEEKFGLLNVRREMSEKWRMGMFFASLPVLLELALVLFFLGLIQFFNALGVNKVTIPTTLAISLALLFLLVTTAIPTLQIFTVRSRRTQFNSNVPTPCPYKSPQARLFRLFVSSRLGNVVAYYTFVPAYSLLVRSMVGAQSLQISYCFSQYISRPFSRYWSVLVELFPTKALQGLWSKVQRGVSGLVNSRHASQRSPAPSIQYFTVNSYYNLFDARSWTELDMEWVSLRRLYYSQEILPNTRFLSPGCFDRDMIYGPPYEHLHGIQHFCGQYQQYLDLLYSADQCFLDRILIPNPGKSSFYKEEYYEALICVLRKPGTLIISDIIPGQFYEKSNLICDDLHLLFLMRFLDISFMKKELTRQVLDAFFNAIIAGQVDNPLPLNKYFPYPYTMTLCEQLCEELRSANPDISQGRIDWTLHHIFADQLEVVMGQYLRLRLHSTTSNVRERIDRAAQALNATLRNRIHSEDPEVDHNVQAHAYLTAWVIIRVYPDCLGDRPPEGVIKLAKTVYKMSHDMRANPTIPLYRYILKVAGQIWDVTEERALGRIGEFGFWWDEWRRLYSPDTVEQGSVLVPEHLTSARFSEHWDRAIILLKRNKDWSHHEKNDEIQGARAGAEKDIFRPSPRLVSTPNVDTPNVDPELQKKDEFSNPREEWLEYILPPPIPIPVPLLPPLLLQSHCLPISHLTLHSSTPARHLLHLTVPFLVHRLSLEIKPDNDTSRFRAGIQARVYDSYKGLSQEQDAEESNDEDEDEDNVGRDEEKIVKKPEAKGDIRLPVDEHEHNPPSKFHVSTLQQILSATRSPPAKLS